MITADMVGKRLLLRNKNSGREFEAVVMAVRGLRGENVRLYYCGSARNIWRWNEDIEVLKVFEEVAPI